MKNITKIYVVVCSLRGPIFAATSNAVAGRLAKRMKDEQPDYSGRFHIAPIDCLVGELPS